jgi:hypothetical protein
MRHLQFRRRLARQAISTAQTAASFVSAGV